MHEDFDETYWEKQYLANGGGEHAQLNPVLLAETADLEPGVALDAGCGEGAGSIWLAERGWQVTAVVIASTALGNARRRAERSGADVPGRIEWVHADLTSWPLERDRFDLVCAFYVHTTEPLETQVGRLAASVASGGTLLIVGHGSPDPNHASAPRARFTAGQIAGMLDPGVWDVAVAETRIRSADGYTGQPITLRDAVLCARKRPQLP